MFGGPGIRPLRQLGKQRRTASRSGPGARPCAGHRPVLAVANASVRLAPPQARRALGVRRNPCRPTSSACGASAFFAARRRFLAPPTSARPRSSRLHGFTRRPPNCRSAIPAGPNVYPGGREPGGPGGPGGPGACGPGGSRQSRTPAVATSARETTASPTRSSVPAVKFVNGSDSGKCL